MFHFRYEWNPRHMFMRINIHWSISSKRSVLRWSAASMQINNICVQYTLYTYTTKIKKKCLNALMDYSFRKINSAASIVWSSSSRCQQTKKPSVNRIFSSFFCCSYCCLFNYLLWVYNMNFTREHDSIWASSFELRSFGWYVSITETAANWRHWYTDSITANICFFFFSFSFSWKFSRVDMFM